jgi:hypothetical protein
LRAAATARAAAPARAAGEARSASGLAALDTPLHRRILSGDPENLIARIILGFAPGSHDEEAPGAAAGAI